MSLNDKFAAPPFWMTTFDEFNDLRSVQKKFYIENLQKQLFDLPSVPKKDDAFWESAQIHPDKWEEIMTEVYLACDQMKNRKKCDQIAAVRLKTFEIFENMKSE